MSIAGRLDLKGTKSFRQIDEAILKQAPAIRPWCGRSYMGVQTMNKQSGNNVTSQDDQNEPNLERELTDDELNTVDGAGRAAPAPSKTTTSKGLFEVEDYSFDIEQVLSIGSQSTGAGAGKVTFNPF
ncbi:hypothetical protein [Bradyrhizobium sp.]|uniref:hypothetical protein n=1 Tax=Bradyrhizobium sp. TaxID=376 RepID=UPI003BB0B59C